MFFWRKSEMAARGHIKIVRYEEFYIYSYLIPLFRLIFHGEPISGLLFKFWSLIRVLIAKIQNGRLIQYRDCNLWRNSNIVLCNIFFLHNFSRGTYFWSYFNIVKLLSLYNSKWPPLGKKNYFRNDVIFCLHIFLFGNIVTVKSIYGIKGGNAMWFNPVNCTRCCSSLSCDNNNDKLRCMKILRWQQGPLCHCACHNNCLTCPWYY